METTNSNPIPQAISPVDAIWSIIQSQSKDVKQAIFLRVEEERRETQANSERVLKQLKELAPGPAGFLQLDSILPASKMTVEELREDAYEEKYGLWKKFL